MKATTTAAIAALTLMAVAGCGSDLGVDWNTQRTLTVSNTGGGAVTSEPAGIACPPTCSAEFGFGETVTLTATEIAPSRFARWEGRCQGATCTVDLTDGDAVVAAVFRAPLSISLAGPGTGAVHTDPPAIDCPGTCDAYFDYGSSVELQPVSSSSERFTGWLAGCENAGACVLTIDGPSQVTAGFGVLTSTQFGGADLDEGLAVELDATGAPLLAGKVRSLTTGQILNGATGAYVGTYSPPQGFEWFAELSGSAGVEPRGVAANEDNAIFAVGRVDDNTAFVTRLPAHGFSERIADINSDVEITAEDVVGLPGGSIVAVGAFRDNLRVQTNNFLSFMSSDGAGDEDAWVVVLNASLSSINVERIGGVSSTDDSEALAVAAGDDGEIFLAGRFRGVLQAAGEHASAGGWDAFVAKLGSDLAPLWCVSLGGPGDDTLADLAVDPDSGDVIVVGSYAGTITVGSDTHTSNGGRDAIAVRLDGQTGTPLWSSAFGGSDVDEASSVAIREGTAVIGGTFASEFRVDDLVRTGAGGTDLFVARLRVADGIFTWADTWGGPADDRVTGVALSPTGLLITGSFENTLDFGDAVRPSAGLADGFVLSVEQ